MRIKNAPRHRCALEALEDRRLLSAAIDNGDDNDLLYDAANHTTWMAYYDSASQSLKVRSRADGSAWSADTVLDAPSGLQVGRYPSIAQSANGTIGVAYYDASNADLKYVERNVSTGVWGTPEIADSGGRSGSYPSLAYNSKNRPFVAYYTDVNGGDDFLRLNFRDNTGWSTPQVIDTGTDVGRYSSLLFTSTGWAASYVTGSGCKYVFQSGNSFVRESIDNTGAGTYSDLALDSNGVPWVSYYRSTDTRVLVGKRTSVNNGAWPTPQSVYGGKGYYTNLWFEPNGEARLVFKDAAASVNKVRKFNYASGAWQSAANTDTVLFDGVADEVSAVRGANGAITFTGVTSIQTADNPASYTKTLQVRDQADASLGQNWPKVTQSTLQPAPGGSNPAVIYDGKMWIVAQTTSARDDVWYSADNGVNWTNATAGLTNGAAFGTRHDSQLTVFNGEMWVTGGYNGLTYFSDAWHSTNGVTWTRAATGAYPGREGHSAVVNNGRLYVIGGENMANGLLNDVWSSADGATWRQDLATAPFTPRAFATALVYEDRIWLVGGYIGGLSTASNQIWSSADGSNWLQVSSSTAPMRWGSAGVVFDNRMWLLGGRDSANNQSNQVYYSIDGATWVQSATLPEARSEAAALFANNQMWLIGGSVPGVVSNNDVLYSNP